MRRYFILAVFAGLTMSYLLLIHCIDFVSDTIDVYGLKGWRPFESAALCGVYLILIFVIYHLKLQTNAPGKANSNNEDWTKAKRRLRPLHRSKTESQMKLILVLSVLIFTLPAFDCLHLTELTVVEKIKSKTLQENSNSQLPTASKMNVDGRTVSNQDFSNQDLTMARAAQATFENVSFSGASLQEADFRDARFVTGVVFNNAKLCGADMRGADLTGASGLTDGTDLRFLIVNRKTKFPPNVLAMNLNGIVYDDANIVRLYQCNDGIARILRPDGTRD